MRTAPSQLFIGLAFLLLVCAGIAYYFVFSEPKEGVVSFKNQYELVLQDYEGTDVELSTFKRKVLLIHVWASWCPYCKEELQNLARLKSQYGDELEIVAINRAESLSEAQAFTDVLQIRDSIRILLDPEDSFYKEIGGYAMPETLFINDRGEILFHQRGPMTLPELNEKIKPMIES